MFIPKSSDVWSGKKIMKSKANRVVTTAMMVQTWEKSPKTRKRQKWRLDQHNKQTPYLEVTINIYFKFFKQADAPLGYWNGWTLMVSIHTIHLPQVFKNQHLQNFLCKHSVDIQGEILEPMQSFIQWGYLWNTIITYRL